MILRLFPKRSDNWADPTEWGFLPYMDFLLYFLNHRVLRRISYSVILVKHQSPRVSVTVYPHHLPLELWHTPWRACRCAVQTPLHGLVAQPLEVLLVGNLKLSGLSGRSLCTMTQPGGCMKAWPVGMSQQSQRVITSELPWGQLGSSGQCSNLIFSSALSHFFRLDSTSADPNGTLNTHANTELYPSLHVREPTCNMYQKTFSSCTGFLFENTVYTHT